MSSQSHIKITRLEAENLLIGTRFLEMISDYFHMPISEFPRGYEFYVVGPQKMMLFYENGTGEKLKVMTFRDLPAKNFEVLGFEYKKRYQNAISFEKRVQLFILLVILMWILYSIIGIVINLNM